MKKLLPILFLAGCLTAHAAVPTGVIHNLSSDQIEKRFEGENALQKLALDAGAPGVDPSKAAELEKELLTLASDKSSPLRTRLCALDQLPFLASSASVPGLAALLDDPEGSVREAARRALQTNPSPAASAPLLQALEKTVDPAWSLGLIDSLSVRRDSSAVPALASKLKSSDPAVASLAAQALGTLGGKESFDALSGYLPNCPAPILAIVQSATLRCAESLSFAPKSFWSSLSDRFDKLRGKPGPDDMILSLWPTAANAGIRCQVFKTLMNTGKDNEAIPLLADAIAKKDMPGRREILHLAVLSNNQSLIQPVLEVLPSLDEDARLTVHAALAQKGDSSREDDLLAFAPSLEGTKRARAIEALAVCGTGKSLEFLISEAAKKSPQTLPSTSHAINRLNVPGLDQRLLEQAKAGFGPEAERAMLLLSYRNPEGTESLLLELAAPGANPDSRKAALASLETVGGFETGSRLLKWIAQTPPGSDPKPYIAAFRRIGPRLNAESALWKEAFLPQYESATDENRTILLQTIPALRCPDFGATMVEWIREDTGRRPMGIELISSWNDVKNGDSLLAAAALPNIDNQTRENLFLAATKIFFPNASGQIHLKKAYAAKVLAAAPEGPIRESVLKAMADANLPK